ncbi:MULTISPECIES: class I adenylate-forming enzyme family protein [unclassified Brenneria]|uniref:class I adenylate-forming enzyme family protein n=1 Tax=unclassified Brenneria TaxID=2634434 RepID=UPI0018F09F24|nr:class I adenylate-forming enzyme family protein [Brenneria sp. L3-3C-1]MBJ7221975.1 acyl--CoA ligase [Brenneria sp. L3-3C-1]MEE3643217.1 class I adenylate-forming enzyme family protein [Brenneria sp. L3_3C_1]
MKTPVKITPDSAQRFINQLVQVDLPQDAAPQIVVAEILENIRAQGIEPGEPVMVAMPNSVQFVAVVFALLAHGAVPVLLPSSAPPSRIQRIGQVIGANVLIALHIASGLAQTQPTRPLTQAAKLAVLGQVKARRYRPGEIILLTSGTSGIFSGCLFTIDALFLNASYHAQAVEQTPADRVLINLPMYYSYAFVAQLLSTFALGNRAIIAGPPFTPRNYEQTIETYQITQSSLTPMMIDAWLQSGSERLPAPLRRLTIGGDAINPGAVENMLARNPGIELYLTYGLTQAGPRVATLAAHREPPDKYASVGLPFPEVKTYLRKEHPDDAAGELIVETGSGMIRRINGRDDEADTALNGVRRVICTGDRFIIDDDGYLFFQHRNPTYVMSRGEKVCLKSVCEIAETIAGISRAEAWVHQNNGDSGEVAFTLDVYCHDGSLTEGDIRRQLGKVLLRSELPKNLEIHPASDIGWRKTASAANAVTK